jgi:hypothetical protein
MGGCGPWRAGDGLFPGCPGSLHVLLGVHGAVGSWGRHRTAQGVWACTASRGSASRQLAEVTPVQLRTRCGPWRAGDRLFPGGTGSLDVLLGVHGAVGSWGRHVSVQGLWTHMASRGSASRQLAEVTPVQLRTRCGPWRAGDGLFPGGPGSLHVLLGVHGAVGSWGRHRTAQGVWECTASRGSASRQLAEVTPVQLRTVVCVLDVAEAGPPSQR